MARQRPRRQPSGGAVRRHPVAHVVVDEERRFHELMAEPAALEAVADIADPALPKGAAGFRPRVDEGSRRRPDEPRRAVPHRAVAVAVAACHQLHTVFFT